MGSETSQQSFALNIYSQLINLGFEDDNLCLKAAKKYPKNINQAMDFILKHQHKNNDTNESKSDECCQHHRQVNQLLQQVNELNLEKEYWKNKYHELTKLRNNEYKQELELNMDQSNKDKIVSRFMKIMQNYDGNIENKSEYYDSSLLSDFLHLLDKCSNDRQFEVIANKMGHCDVLKCTIAKRHYRDRKSNNFFTKQDEKQRAICQIYDKIHCFYYHCYDIGYRLPIKQQISDHDENNTDKSFDNSCINNNIIQLKEIISNKKKLYQNGDIDINIRMNNRYSQLNKEYMSLESVEDKNKNSYSFGHLFHYCQDKPKYSSVPANDGQYLMNPTDDCDEIELIYPKHSSFKQELTDNKVCTISVIQFNTELEEARIHFHSKYRKQYYPKMDVECLFALMIYCNFDTIQYEFSKTFRCNVDKHMY
eukprot:305484_1